MDVATPKAFVQNPLHGAVAGGAHVVFHGLLAPVLAREILLPGQQTVALTQPEEDRSREQPSSSMAV